MARDIERADAWGRYDILSCHEDDYGGHNWFRINFQLHPTRDRSAEFRVKQVGRSGSMEYIASARVDKEWLSEYASEVDHMLDSFRF